MKTWKSEENFNVRDIGNPGVYGCVVILEFGILNAKKPEY